MPNITTNHAITYTTTTTTTTIEQECKLQMVSDWLKKERNQREPIILELFWQQNSVRKWPRFSANNDLILHAKRLKNFKNTPKPEHSKKYVFRAKCIENVVLK